MQGIILSGIYQHYKGRLYFVTHTFNYKGKNGDVESVYYYPLYEVSDGYGRSIDDFIEQAYEEDGVAVERFKLIMALPPEAKNILLYGSIVISTRGSSRKWCVR